MSKLDYRHFHFVVDICQTVSLVIDHELEDSQSPWGLQLVSEGGRVLVCLNQGYLVVWVEHRELELDIIGLVWDPGAVFLRINVDKVLNINLPLVIFRISSIPLFPDFVVSDVINFENASFLQVPFCHLSTEDVVWRSSDGVAMNWISSCHHGCVAAHLRRTGHDHTLVVASLVASDHS